MINYHLPLTWYWTFIVITIGHPCVVHLPENEIRMWSMMRMLHCKKNVHWQNAVKKQLLPQVYQTTLAQETDLVGQASETEKLSLSSVNCRNWKPQWRVQSLIACDHFCSAHLTWGSDGLIWQRPCSAHWPGNLEITKWPGLDRALCFWFDSDVGIIEVLLGLTLGMTLSGSCAVFGSGLIQSVFVCFSISSC